jgi:hypothetical protein
MNFGLKQVKSLNFITLSGSPKIESLPNLTSFTLPLFLFPKLERETGGEYYLNVIFGYILFILDATYAITGMLKEIVMVKISIVVT